MGKTAKQKHLTNKLKKPRFDRSTRWGKFWYFIWEEDSFASWTVNVVLAFLIIKFLVYPGLGFVLGTTHPIVAVVSGSMEHDGSFNDWWTEESCCDNGVACFNHESIYDNYGISEGQFKDYSFKNGFNKGDLMVLASGENAEVGDIIVFVTRSFPEPIIHRVVQTQNGRYSTKGDHNCGSSKFESDIVQDSVIGKAVLRIPYLGWIKLGFVEIINLFAS